MPKLSCPSCGGDVLLKLGDGKVRCAKCGQIAAVPPDVVVTPDPPAVVVSEDTRYYDLPYLGKVDQKSAIVMFAGAGALLICLGVMISSLFGGRSASGSSADDARRSAEETQRLAEEKAARRASLARGYAHSAGRQIMDAVGGGQDLITSVTSQQFDEYAQEFLIEIEVSFNGALFRNNNYLVGGVLKCREDGSSPEFSRRYANENYQNVEQTIQLVNGAAMLLKSLDEGQ